MKLIHLGFSVHNHIGEVVDDNSEVEIFSIKHKWVIVREHTVLGEDPVCNTVSPELPVDFY